MLVTQSSVISTDPFLDMQSWDQPSISTINITTTLLHHCYVAGEVDSIYIVWAYKKQYEVKFMDGFLPKKQIQILILEEKEKLDFTDS